MWQPVFHTSFFGTIDRMKYKYAVGQMRKHEKDCQEHLEFRAKTDNAGTGKCRRGAIEHGCELAPVAGVYDSYVEILSAPCRHYVAFVVDG